MEEVCSHLTSATGVEPNSQGCAACLKIGDEWVHLRLCLTCGNVGCCDQSKNTHASKHARTTGHPVVRSFEPGEDWTYCYIDDLFYEPE